MSNYESVLGDTFESIARKNYGTERLANLVSSANPGVFEPITAGTNIIILIITEQEFDEAFENQSTDDEVILFIRGKRFRFWNKIELVESIDTIAQIALDAPFESNRQLFKESFRPFKFDPMRITLGGDTLFTGTMVSIVPDMAINGRIVNVKGYALPGILNDSMAPASLAPLEFEKMNLRDIAFKLCEPFGISPQFSNEPGDIFEKVSCSPTVKVFSFLSDLAAQRNFIMTSTQHGQLLFHRDTDQTGKPRAKFVEGESPLQSITPNFNPQNYYSHISGIQEAPIFSFQSELKPYTKKNERLDGVIRPFVYRVKDADGITGLQQAVETKMGRMFANAASYDIEVSTWRDSENRLWRPNTTIKLLAPGAMIYNNYEFIIRKVKFVRTTTKFVATLNLISPGTLSGKIPESLPWDL